MKKLLIVDVAALGWDLVSRMPPKAQGLDFKKTQTVFPAMTCPVQASFRTGSLPRDHGITSNGLFFRDLRRPMFWEQSATLAAGPRIWDGLRARGGKVGMLFWQQSLGERVDLVMTPKPVHKHHGGMMQDCYSQPPELYSNVSNAVGRPFNLMQYWGPLAGKGSSDWIVKATLEILSTPQSPDVLLAYIPHLDYDLQRFGPHSAKAQAALDLVYGWLARLASAAGNAGYDHLFFGDYNIEEVSGPPVFPNRALLEAGLFSVRRVCGRAYPDFFSSRAFAMADHQVAHVFVSDEQAEQEAARLLRSLDGIERVLEFEEQKELGVESSRSGELLVVAERGRWIAYPWWTDRADAPDYAGHVDIHNKPGYDPCELFFGWPPGTVSGNTGRVRGTHGRTGPGTETAWCSSLQFDKGSSILAIAQGLASRFDGKGESNG